MMKLVNSKLAGCYEIFPKIFFDDRGKFVKTFHSDSFKRFNLCTNFKEEYYSISNKNVLRGLHFQLPPEDHVKLVYCIQGMATDVIVDLRLGSNTYGQYEVFNLSNNKGNILYIPKGVAHGSLAEQDNTILVYKTSTVHAPNKDSGLRWNSLGIDWPKANYIISDRDKNLETFENFVSPFTMEL